MAVAPTHQREIHAVVVDTPSGGIFGVRFSYTWGALPMFDLPEEESPTKIGIGGSSELNWVAIVFVLALPKVPLRGVSTALPVHQPICGPMQIAKPGALPRLQQAWLVDGQGGAYSP